jgi:hypothetical protein
MFDMFIYEVQTSPKPAPDDQPAQGMLSVLWSLIWRAPVLTPFMILMLLIGMWAIIGAVLLPITAFICWQSGDSTKAGWLLLAWPFACGVCYALRRFIDAPAYLCACYPFGKSDKKSNP